MTIRPYAGNMVVGRSADSGKIQQAIMKSVTDLLQQHIFKQCKAAMQRRFLSEDWQSAALAASHKGDSRSEVLILKSFL